MCSQKIYVVFAYVLTKNICFFGLYHTQTMTDNFRIGVQKNFHLKDKDGNKRDFHAYPIVRYDDYWFHYVWRYLHGCYS